MVSVSAQTPALTAPLSGRKLNMDHRVKPGGDEGRDFVFEFCEPSRGARTLSTVMPGLDPGIHGDLPRHNGFGERSNTCAHCAASQGRTLSMDHRVKPGGDEGGASSLNSDMPSHRAGLRTPSGVMPELDPGIHSDLPRHNGFGEHSNTCAHCAALRVGSSTWTTGSSPVVTGGIAFEFCYADSAGLELAQPSCPGLTRASMLM